MSETTLPVTVAVEKLESFAGTDLQDLCEATEAAIEEGGGFGWVRKPRREMLEKYWQGVLDGARAAALRRAARRPHLRLGAAHPAAPQQRGASLQRAAHERASSRPGRAATASPAASSAPSSRRARQLGIEILNLDIRDTQTAAIQLYESRGYTRWGTHPAYAKVDGRIIPGHYYYKNLTIVRAGAGCGGRE